MAVAAETFRRVLGQWPTGVTVVTTVDGDGRHGMTASSFASVSLDPPLVSVCVATAAATHARISASGVFAVNILSADQVETGKRFAGFYPDLVDRFAGDEWTTAATGSPVLAAALGWVDCRVLAAHPGGDHTIFVGEVLAGDTPAARAPLLYHARSWGQFADVLPETATVLHVGGCDAVTAQRLEAAGVVLADTPDVEIREPSDLSALHADPFRAVLVVSERHGLAPAGVADLAAAAYDAGAVEVCLADGDRDMSPLDLRALLQAVMPVASRRPVSVRLSDAEGLGSANVLTALKSGVVRFDTALDGRDAIATRLVVTLLERMGIATGVAARALLPRHEVSA